MSIQKTILSTVIITVTTFLFAFTVKAANDPIPLYQNSHNIKTLVSQSQAENFDAWESFTNKFGSWNVTIDKATGTPAVAFGKPIKILDASDLNEKSVLTATKIFLNENKNVFKVNTEQLELQRVEFVQNRWYVTFGQVYNYTNPSKGVEISYEVMFSDVQFTINDKGEVFAFKITFYDNINLPTTPQISINKMLNTVGNSLVDNPYIDKKLTNSFQSSEGNKQFIIPIYNGNNVSHHLVHQINTSNNQGMRLFESFVDAHSGEILWQRSYLQNYEAKIKMKVKTFDKYNFEPEKEFPLARGKIIVNGKQRMLDGNGEITLTEPADEIKFAFESDITEVYFGYYFDNDSTVKRQRDSVKFQISEGENELLLDENNSTKYSRFAIHHLNVAKQRILEIDPSLKCLDISIPLRFYEIHMFLNSPNAFYNRDELNREFGFVMYNQDTVLLSTCPAVMYHEYGHAINDLFYKSRGREFVNGACGEALSDVNANMILDDPIGTQKIFVNAPDEYIRNSDNNNIYPDSIIDAWNIHHTGLILAGAYWDLRKLTSVETAYRLSHFARYELPDDEDNGAAFYEWFIATLIADDDDGDLTNGTPNFNAIVTAFDLHNIGFNLFIFQNIEFFPPKDIRNEQKPQKFEVTITNLYNFVLPVKLPDSMEVVYSTDYFETTNRATLYKNENKYLGEIPAFDEPQTVRYYLEYIDANSNKIFTLEQTNPLIVDFVYNTGYHTIWKEGFENNPQYSIETNFYTGGGLDKGEGWSISQLHTDKRPNFQITDGGRRCLVTSRRNRNGLNNGNSTAISPEYNIPKVNGNLYIGCWIFEDTYFYIPAFGGTEALNDTTNGFHFLYKTDKMDNWDTIHISVRDPYNGIPSEGEGYYRLMQNKWKKCLFKLPEDVSEADKITLKFYVGSRQSYGNSWTSFNANVLVDDIELLTDDATVSVSEALNNFSITSNPNPFTTETNIITTSAFPQVISGKLVDISGKIISTFENLQINEGETVIPLASISKQNLTVGVYILTVTVNGKTYSCKIIRK